MTMKTRDEHNDIFEAGRRAGLEQAEMECRRHAGFLKDEAHKGGDWKHLMTRHEEAIYNACCINALAKERDTQRGPAPSVPSEVADKKLDTGRAFQSWHYRLLRSCGKTSDDPGCKQGRGIYTN